MLSARCFFAAGESPVSMEDDTERFVADLGSDGSTLSSWATVESLASVASGDADAGFRSDASATFIEEGALRRNNFASAADSSLMDMLSGTKHSAIR